MTQNCAENHVGSNVNKHNLRELIKIIYVNDDIVNDFKQVI